MRNIIRGLLGAIIMFGLLLGLGFILNNYMGVQYTGKELLTEAQYQEFKETLGSDYITINSLTVLSSQEPILVNFSVMVKDGKDFPYGEPQDVIPWIIIPAVVISIFAGVLFFLWQD